MQSGLVRGIAYLHLARRHATPVPPGVAEDPNRLVDASGLAHGLEALSRSGGDEAVEAVARAMVASWKRTFPTLVRYLRGRPERCLNLWAMEVYPFLRGDRLAARVERVAPGHARLVLHDDLPAPFLCALVAGFTELSGATAEAQALGSGTFAVRYRSLPLDRLASLLWYLASLRLPLLVASAVGAAVGIAAAYALGPVAWLKAAAVLLGVISVQAGASAVHELRRPATIDPLGLPRPSRAFWILQAAGGYTVGGACGIFLAFETPGVLAFMAAGIVVAFLYPLAQDAGWGPTLAGFTYGPLTVAGAVHALQPDRGLEAILWAFLVSLPAAFLAAATLFIGDLADRPLDEAGGRRTLAVRLPRSEHLWVYAALLALALLALLPNALSPPARALLLVPFAAGAWALVQQVRQHIEDPRGLAPARIGTAAMQLAGAAILALLLVNP